MFGTIVKEKVRDWFWYKYHNFSTSS